MTHNSFKPMTHNPLNSMQSPKQHHQLTKQHHRPPKQHHRNFETNPRLKSHSNQQPVQTPNLEASGRGRGAVLQRRTETPRRRPVSGCAPSTRRNKPLQPMMRPPLASVVPKPRLTSASSSFLPRQLVFLLRR